MPPFLTVTKLSVCWHMIIFLNSRLLTFFLPDRWITRSRNWILLRDGGYGLFIRLVSDWKDPIQDCWTPRGLVLPPDCRWWLFSLKKIRVWTYWAGSSLFFPPISLWLPWARLFWVWHWCQCDWALGFNWQLVWGWLFWPLLPEPNWGGVLRHWWGFIGGVTWEVQGCWFLAWNQWKLQEF